MRWSEAGYLSQFVLSHALRQASVSLILDVRQKNMKTTSIALLILSIALGACGPFEIPGPGSSDFSADLGNGYSLGRTSGVYVVISPQRGYSSDSEIIDTRILECGFDTRFVVAKRLDIKSIPEERWGDALQNPDPQHIDYWIIETEQKKRHGPLTEAQFHETRAKLGVPPGLQLRDIYYYRPKEK
jgi:hypothetical protein